MGFKFVSFLSFLIIKIEIMSWAQLCHLIDANTRMPPAGSHADPNPVEPRKARCQASVQALNYDDRAKETHEWIFSFSFCVVFIRFYFLATIPLLMRFWSRLFSRCWFLGICVATKFTKIEGRHFFFSSVSCVSIFHFRIKGMNVLFENWHCVRIVSLL